MRKALRAVAGALGVLTGPAIAAEMASPGDPPVSAPAFTSWTGFYAGGNIGYGWATHTTNLSGVVASPVDPVGFTGGNNGVFSNNLNPPNPPIAPQPFSVTNRSDVNGVIGGGQLGANWQVGSIVLGVEADAQGSSQSKAITFGLPAGRSLIDNFSKPWFATFRGRGGWAFADGWLAYATAGGVWLDSKTTFTPVGLTNPSSSFELSHIGWTAGGGVEAAIDRNWSWKVEYLYMATDNFTTSVNFLGFTVPWKSQISNNVARAGINYRF
jgi:outer membrane immunogenic protein